MQAENIVMDDLHYTIDTETKTAKVYGMIDLKAFAHCNNLEYITLPTSIRTIGDQAFYDSGLCEIQFLKGNNLTQIDDYAFAKCANLKHFMLPAGVQKLENNQF